MGEFAAQEPGAGILFASDVLDSIGAQVSVALIVEGRPEDRRPRSLVRLYQRRLRSRPVARHGQGDAEVLLMIRPAGNGTHDVRSRAAAAN